MKPFNKLAVISVLLLSDLFFSCYSIRQSDTEGVVLNTTRFYNKEGKPVFTHYLKLWYKDSLCIQEIRGVNTVRDTSGITTVTYPLLFCRFMDLKSKTMYDYKTFSDTATIVKKAVLPDSILLDAGWNFYSEKDPKIIGTPEPLSDTVIENVEYKRAKFYFSLYNPKERYLIGFFRCNGSSDMFSLEKEYSRKINCTMVKYLDYKVGQARPFASIEVSYLSDKLTDNELRIFTAWEKNERENPVVYIVKPGSKEKLKEMRAHLIFD
jgi:hypothetical protein